MVMFTVVIYYFLISAITMTKNVKNNKKLKKQRKKEKTNSNVIHTVCNTVDIIIKDTNK